MENKIYFMNDQYNFIGHDFACHTVLEIANKCGYRWPCESNKRKTNHKIIIFSEEKGITSIEDQEYCKEHNYIEVNLIDAILILTGKKKFPTRNITVDGCNVKFMNTVTNQGVGYAKIFIENRTNIRLTIDNLQKMIDILKGTTT